jgi:hypothetical protein
MVNTNTRARRLSFIEFFELLNFSIQGLNKWVEIGNSGVIRPEMLLPMGLPSDVVVIAWGLSLERLLGEFSTAFY